MPMILRNKNSLGPQLRLSSQDRCKKFYSRGIDPTLYFIQ